MYLYIYISQVPKVSEALHASRDSDEGRSRKFTPLFQVTWLCTCLACTCPRVPGSNQHLPFPWILLWSSIMHLQDIAAYSAQALWETPGAITHSQRFWQAWNCWWYGRRISFLVMQVKHDRRRMGGILADGNSWISLGRRFERMRK